MQDIYGSATKISLILLVLATCIGLFTHVISEETFKLALLMVLSFYFGQKTALAQMSVDANTPDDAPKPDEPLKG